MVNDKVCGRSEAVLAFLKDALARGPVPVSNIEVAARAAGLLRDGQSLKASKPFKSAKRALGIRSRRNGFGPDGQWLWSLHDSAAPELSQGHLCGTENPKEAAYGGVANREHIVGDHQHTVAIVVGDHQHDVEGHQHDGDDRRYVRERIPVKDKHVHGTDNSKAVTSAWASIVDRLARIQPPRGTPPHRWGGFVGDCEAFLRSARRWAERAANLGWTASDLFASPALGHDTVGLLWTLNGGELIELHSDWALIETAGSRNRRVVNRQSIPASNIPIDYGEHLYE